MNKWCWWGSGWRNPYINKYNTKVVGFLSQDTGREISVHVRLAEPREGLEINFSSLCKMHYVRRHPLGADNGSRGQGGMVGTGARGARLEYIRLTSRLNTYLWRNGKSLHDVRYM